MPVQPARRIWGLVLGLGLLTSACAGTRRTPEKAGWGITAAQERKRVREEKHQEAAAKEKEVQQSPTFELTPIAPPN
jgi:hypothetical protein